jgi:hypothetical protein
MRQQKTKITDNSRLIFVKSTIDLYEKYLVNHKSKVYLNENDEEDERWFMTRDDRIIRAKGVGTFIVLFIEDINHLDVIAPRQITKHLKKYLYLINHNITPRIFMFTDEEHKMAELICDDADDFLNDWKSNDIYIVNLFKSIGDNFINIEFDKEMKEILRLENDISFKAIKYKVVLNELEKVPKIFNKLLMLK